MMRPTQRSETPEAFAARHPHLSLNTVATIVTVARDNLYQDDVIDAVLGHMTEHQAEAILSAAGVEDSTVFNTAARQLSTRRPR